MSFELTNFQRQELGRALNTAGFLPEAFILEEQLDSDDESGSATLTNRESQDFFSINGGMSATRYGINYSVPGTRRTITFGDNPWNEVTARLQNWATELKRENDAINPWQNDMEDMANDDSYFTLDELPRVDRAIDDSLNELKVKALEHGVTLERIEAELAETNKILKKSARNSKKSEWLTIFKGVILEKIIDWGMQTVVFQSILAILITSAHDIAQLAEHASRHLP